MENLKIRDSIILCAAFLIFMFLMVSCGKKAVKPVSEDSKIAQEAFGLADTIKDAYIRNDRGVLAKNATKDGYKEIMENRKNFDSAELFFAPRWVEIEDTTVNLQVTWNGTWSLRGKKIEDRGLAVFVMEGRPLKLAKVLRDNPFKKPE